MSQTAIAADIAATNPLTEVAATAAAQAAASQTQFISFAIGDDQYGVDIMAVEGVIETLDRR